MISLDPADHDVGAVLTRVGCSFVKFLCRPGAMSPLRTVIAISDRMPEIRIALLGFRFEVETAANL